MFGNVQNPGAATNDGTDGHVSPKLSYLSMYVDDQGRSRLSLCELGGFARKSLGDSAAEMWMRRFPGTPSEVWFTVLPVGWVGDWHETPGPQWVAALSGRWWIETADGNRIEMGPGEIHWGQDIGTCERRGHRSGQMGNVPCVQLMVRYGDVPGDGGSCPFGSHFGEES